MNSKKIIGIIFGGRSSEREVSLVSGRNVFNTLDRDRFAVKALYWDQNFAFWEIPETLVIRNTCKEIDERLSEKGRRIAYEALREEIEIAFLTTHGKYGDDGALQGLLELLRIPYTGSDVLGASLGLDKIIQRFILQNTHGVKTPPFMWCDVRSGSAAETVAESVGFPCVVKPSREGSTIGVVKVNTPEEFDAALRAAGLYDNRVLIEPLIIGREFSCMVVGNEEPRAFLPTETKYEGSLFTYDHKYLPGASQKITPIDAPASTISEIQKQCVLTYQALKMRDYARIDGFVQEEGSVLVTDPNSAASTGLGPSSWTFHQAAKEGMLPTALLSHFIDLVMKRKKL